MTSWRSLYLPFADKNAITTAIDAALIALGYQRYDPFGIVPGKAYPQAVRLFLAPERGGWTRLIGESDAALLPELSRLAPVLSIELDDTKAHISAYADGAASALETAFVRSARTPDCLAFALEQTGSSGSAALGGVALDALPGDVQALAQNIDLKQANSMFARLSGSLAPKSGGAPSDLLQQPHWNSAGGAQITALMDCLGVPDWRDPDFVTLRDAYALHERRRRSPNARLYPGDAETLAAVPNAFDYTPIYAGKT